MFDISPYIDCRRICYTLFEEVDIDLRDKFIEKASRYHALRTCQGFYLEFRHRFPEPLEQLHARYENGTSNPNIWISTIETIEDMIALTCMIDGFPPPAPDDLVYLDWPRAVLPREALPPRSFKYPDYSAYKPISYIVGGCIFYGALCKNC